ncbi:protein laz1 [Quercus suber]|uniref:Protein laz1 n=1 Tax=Quercus suber TaxID=58331 RepID=A0AAW0LXW6_QUESU
MSYCRVWNLNSLQAWNPDMDTMKEENDAYGDTVSSAPKRMGCRTSSIWSDFEILPKGPDGKERAKCKKCQNSFVADSRDTNSLLRHKAKCHELYMILRKKVSWTILATCAYLNLVHMLMRIRWPLLPLFPLYVFPAKPYELMGDRFLESISVLGNYSADCPYEFDVMFKWVSGYLDRCYASGVVIKFVYTFKM